jgi:hypothetical protein
MASHNSGSSEPKGEQLVKTCHTCPYDPVEIETLIETVVDKTVKSTLLQLGMDLSDPIELQRDMQYLRGWRQNSEAMRGRISTALIGGIVGAFLIISVLGFKSWVDSWHAVPVAQGSTTTAAAPRSPLPSLPVALP